MESTKRNALLVLAMLALSCSPLALACGNSCGYGSTPAPSGGGTPVAPVIGGIVGGVAPVVGGVVGGVAPVVGGVVGKVPPVVGGVVGEVPPVVGGVVGKVAPIVGGVAGGATPVVGGVVGEVTPVVGGVVGGIVGGGYSPPKRQGGRKACPPSPYTPTPTPTPSSSDNCPVDALKFGVCVDLLGNDVHIGDSHVQCCQLVKGVAGLSAAACLCTAIKAKVLDLSVYAPIALKLLVNCGCDVPPGYTCA
ncbi:hypothetical protein GUJ93_ZPchr0004g38170 [Zizania palustris]|uniref:Bifunctional inhibitor/plant lipid transfer protein/seed storage helical domain-containing protein n=1 Tax=Zizania palustris TaxID=103762 RepID=A0A8J5SL51_ZIZPA|nr:hypothetical protein GUJ93_ZPchr0004g38170 [Zizania palustris]